MDNNSSKEEDGKKADDQHNNNESKRGGSADSRKRKTSAGGNISQRRNFTHSLSTSGAAGGDSRRSRENSQGDTDRPRSRRTSLNQPGPSGDDLMAAANNSAAMSEASLEKETQEVVQSFLVSSYQLDCRHEMGEMQPDADNSPFGEATPNIPELQNFPGNPLNPSTQIGRRLAHLGDEFQDRYQSQLDEMVALLLPRILSSTSPRRALNEAYEAFRSVASRLFESGVNWGRIISLMCFGYRMAMALWRHGVRDFVGNVVSMVVRFIIGERIARWIAENGGWVASLNYQIETDSALSAVANSFYKVVLFASAALILWNFYSNRR